MKVKSKKRQSKKQKLPIRITDTTLRDAHQSLWATRMRIDDIMKIIDTIDSVGYYSLEVWGGATFDVCLRFLRENPWERLRLIKSKAKKTPLQMLLRGQNLVGYKNFPDDLVDRFVATAIENGIDIFRIFDALNDTRNLEAAIRAVKKYGSHAQGTLSYTISPVHTVERYVQDAKNQVELGIDSLCIKDMAGILSPTSSEKLVGALVKEIDIPIQIHCHATSGMAVSSYMSGVMGGAGAIDCAIASMAGFSSQPPVETMFAIFQETDYSINLDLEALRKINKHFLKIIPNRLNCKEYRPTIDSEILVHQIPGGMISNFITQLEQQGALDKLPEALTEVTKVRKDLGYPPLVTPTSQIVGTQAVLNVISGKRYKIVPNEVKNYLRGMYGRSPAPIDPSFLKNILGDEKTINHRPADDLKPILPKAPDEIDPKLIDDEEDILSYCLFPEPALEYFKWRRLPPDQRPKTPAEIETESLLNSNKAKDSSKKKEDTIALIGPEDYKGISTLLEKASIMKLNELSFRKGDICLTFRADGALQEINKQNEDISEKPIQVKEKIQKEKIKKEHTAPKDFSKTIKSIMTGTFYTSSKSGEAPLVKEGSIVNKGDTVCIVEAMKLFNEITAPSKCKIIKILAENAQQIKKGQPLMAIEEL